MKKTYLFFLALPLLLSGCGTDPVSSETSSSSVSSEETSSEVASSSSSSEVKVRYTTTKDKFDDNISKILEEGSSYSSNGTGSLIFNLSSCKADVKNKSVRAIGSQILDRQTIQVDEYIYEGVQYTKQTVGQSGNKLLIPNKIVSAHEWNSNSYYYPLFGAGISYDVHGFEFESFTFDETSNSYKATFDPTDYTHIDYELVIKNDVFSEIHMVQTDSIHSFTLNITFNSIGACSIAKPVLDTYDPASCTAYAEQMYGILSNCIYGVESDIYYETVSATFNSTTKEFCYPQMDSLQNKKNHFNYVYDTDSKIGVQTGENSTDVRYEGNVFYLASGKGSHITYNENTNSIFDEDAAGSPYSHVTNRIANSVTRDILGRVQPASQPQFAQYIESYHAHAEGLNLVGELSIKPEYYTVANNIKSVALTYFLDGSSFVVEVDFYYTDNTKEVLIGKGGKDKSISASFTEKSCGSYTSWMPVGSDPSGWYLDFATIVAVDSTTWNNTCDQSVSKALDNYFSADQFLSARTLRHTVSEEYDSVLYELTLQVVVVQL